MRKRVMTLLVALALVLTLLPASALAASWCSYATARVDRSVTKTYGSAVARVTTFYDLVSVTLANKTVQNQVNAALRADMDNFFVSADEAVDFYLSTPESIQGSAKQQDNGRVPYSNYVDNKSVFVNRDLISVHNVRSWCYGGVYNETYYCKTLDLHTGAVITLPQYLGMSDADTKSFVRKTLSSNKLEASYYNTYLKNTAPADYKYYLDTAGRLHLVFNSYEVGIGAVGAPDLLTNQTPAAQPDFFVDVVPDSWYTAPVDWAADEGVTSGTDATHFSPDAACTRGQMVTFLWRTMGRPEPKSSANPFTDVNVNDYYGKAVLWAVENGVTQGVGGGLFAPDATVTRAQVVTFLWRTQGQPAASGTNPFRDVPAGEYYAVPVLWAVANNITQGTSSNTFSPNDPCTRAQIVTFLYRALA